MHWTMKNSALTITNETLWNLKQTEYGCVKFGALTDCMNVKTWTNPNSCDNTLIDQNLTLQLNDICIRKSDCLYSLF